MARSHLGAKVPNFTKMLVHVWALLGNCYLKIDIPKIICLVPPPPPLKFGFKPNRTSKRCWITEPQLCPNSRTGLDFLTPPIPQNRPLSREDRPHTSPRPYSRGATDHFTRKMDTFIRHSTRRLRTPTRIFLTPTNSPDRNSFTDRLRARSGSPSSLSDRITPTFSDRLTPTSYTDRLTPDIADPDIADMISLLELTLTDICCDVR